MLHDRCPSVVIADASEDTGALRGGINGVFVVRKAFGECGWCEEDSHVNPPKTTLSFS